MWIKLVVSGAREHNLKDITVAIPRGSLTVITGLSGSGKSSLAFDTIYAEGQRRYVESLSAYARQFLGQMDKPDVDSIEGLSPAISIDQKTTSRNPRSTVGTVTEIYDYLRLLWARIGHPHCHVCGRPISGQSAEQIIDQVMELPEGTRFMVLAPIVRGRKGEYGKQLEELRGEGFGRVKVDGELRRLDEEIALDKKYKHDIAVVVDRLVMKGELRKRLADSIETAVALADGLVEIELVDDRSARTPPTILTFARSSPVRCTGPSLVELEPRIFTFNSPHGACPRCTGLGSQMEIDPELVVPDPTLSIGEGAIAPWAASASDYYDQLTQAIAERYDVDLETPWEELPGRVARTSSCTAPTASGVQVSYRNRFGRRRSYATHVRGDRPEPRAPLPGDRVGLLAREDRGVHDAAAVPGVQGRAAAARVAGGAGRRARRSTSSPRCRRGGRWSGSRALELTEHDRRIARLVLREIEERLQFLDNVGVGYLSMERAAATLSGGEAQRIRLATQIGSSLVGVLYILDEPSIGLHQRDNEKLIATLERLRDLGNTVLVVEHDEGTMRAADHLVDMGPAAGEHGGHVVAQGTAERGRAGARVADRPVPGRDAGDRDAGASGASRSGTSGSRARSQHNLQADRRQDPARACSAASPACRARASRRWSTRCSTRRSPTGCTGPRQRAGAHRRITGLEQLDKIISVDQSPIGRTPRSNPATYIGLFDQIRELFSKTQEARARGYKPGRFSFNVKGGRCEVCRGDGQIKIEMHFLPDVYVPCEQCHGKRYNRETLEVRFKGKTIADVLEMPIEEALEFFAHIPKIRRRVRGAERRRARLHAARPAGDDAVGRRGAAGQARRRAVARWRPDGRSTSSTSRPPGCTSPTSSGCSRCSQRLVDAGNSVVVIEHNLDVIKVADRIIDLGPEGGEEGGRVIATGTPEQVAAVRRLLHRPVPGRAAARAAGREAPEGAGPPARAPAQGRRRDRLSPIRRLRTRTPDADAPGTD